MKKIYKCLSCNKSHVALEKHKILPLIKITCNKCRKTRIIKGKFNCESCGGHNGSTESYYEPDVVKATCIDCGLMSYHYYISPHSKRILSNHLDKKVLSRN